MQVNCQQFRHFWLHLAFTRELIGESSGRGVRKIGSADRRAEDSLSGPRGPQTPPTGTPTPRPADAGK
jgi:hypothetical protein